MPGPDLWKVDIIGERKIYLSGYCGLKNFYFRNYEIQGEKLDRIAAAGRLNVKKRG